MDEDGLYPQFNRHGDPVEHRKIVPDTEVVGVRSVADVRGTEATALARQLP